MTKAATKQVIRDEADAEKRQQDADEKQQRDEADARETRDEVDARRYRYLRDQVRVNGVINEKLYVRCDGRTDGKWALDGKDLDAVLDALLPPPPEPEVASGEK